MTLTVDQVQPDRDEVRAAVAALPQVRDYLARHPEQEMIRLAVDDEHGDEALVMPRAAVELLVRVLTHMAAGQGMSVVPAYGELTTQQAADLLNVSRPFLIGLLEAGEIEYRTVGTHRRVLASSLLEYRGRDDQRRRGAADELTVLTQDMGLA